MIKCEITFEESPQSVVLLVYSGSVVNGKAVITMEKPMNVQGISLIFDGRAHVEWSETEETGMGDSKSTRSQTYSADEQYVRTVTYLIGSSKGDAITIDAGVHTYNFSCLLPSELPSSVEGSNGYIRYTTKIVFERPWKFDKTFAVGLTVLKLTDLNQEDPFIRLPTTLQIQKQFCCWPCSSKPLIIEASTPQTGYVPGQTIPVTVNLHNESGKDIERINVTLKQIIKCTSDFPLTKTKLQTTTVGKIVLTSIKNVSKELMHVDLIIPAVPPSTSETICRIIQVYYELCIKSVIKGPHISPVVRIPICIGNIPLNNFQNQSSQSRNSASIPSENLTGSTSSFTNSKLIRELPPPTYEEAIYINKVDVNKNDRHPISESYYLPRYPVFHFDP